MIGGGAAGQCGAQQQRGEGEQFFHQISLAMIPPPDGCCSEAEPQTVRAARQGDSDKGSGRPGVEFTI